MSLCIGKQSILPFQNGVCCSSLFPVVLIISLASWAFVPLDLEHSSNLSMDGETRRIALGDSALELESHVGQYDEEIKRGCWQILHVFHSEDDGRGSNPECYSYIQKKLVLHTMIIILQGKQLLHITIEVVYTIETCKAKWSEQSSHYSWLPSIS